MLGTSIVPTLVAAGNEVVATDIDLTNPTPWGAKGPKIDWLDIRDRSAVRAAFDTVAPDFVLHLAAETSLEASDDDPDHAGADMTPEEHQRRADAAAALWREIVRRATGKERP